MVYGLAKEVKCKLSIAEMLGYADPQLIGKVANQASGSAMGLKRTHLGTSG